MLCYTIQLQGGCAGHLVGGNLSANNLRLPADALRQVSKGLQKANL